jgi:hypothetical protein
MLLARAAGYAISYGSKDIVRRELATSEEYRYIASREQRALAPRLCRRHGRRGDDAL